MVRPDGTWERVAAVADVGRKGKRLVIHTSSDAGLTWSQPRDLGGTLPGEGWGGMAALRTRDGELQVFVVRSRRVAEGNRPAIDRFIDLWHLRSYDGVKRWSEPKCLYEGWLGSISNAIQLENGRIVMPFGMLIGGRKAGPPTGRHELTVVYSDDHGETFKMSEARLTSPCYEDYNGSNEGACEPAIVQLKDGRVLMHMRTQTGVLYESISSDGANWPDAWPSRFHSSTGPPFLIRLKDDRIALFWNSVEMPPRVDGQGVYGGRDALHAAIADPSLTTWRGWREIYRDPTRNDSPPKRGDRGTAYPDAALMPDGRIAVVSGQGGRRALMYVDPLWLYETSASDDFSQGLANWCVYKGFGPASGWWRDRTQGASLVDHPDRPGKKALHLRRPDEKPADGAVWNFPMAKAGKLIVRLKLNPGAAGGTISLNDRLFDPCDDNGQRLAMFSLPFGLSSDDGRNLELQPAQWQELVFEWDVDQEKCYASLNDQDATPLPLLNKTPNGICYLRLRSAAAEPEQSGFLVESVQVELKDLPAEPR